MRTITTIFPSNTIVSRWSSEIRVYREELQTMANKLRKLSDENEYEEFQPAREYYLDQLTNLSITLNRFIHKIRQNEALFQQMKQQSPGTRLEELRKNHYTLESGMISRIEKELIEVHLDFECFSLVYS